jgi:hypothetical protein
MAALRDEGVGVGRVDEAGDDGSSSVRAAAGRRGFDLSTLIGEFFSKLRAEGLTFAVATSLSECTRAVSFLAPAEDAGDLVWGARDVMGTWLQKSFYLQYVQLAETDSSHLLARGLIFKIPQFPP